MEGREGEKTVEKGNKEKLNDYLKVTRAEIRIFG